MKINVLVSDMTGTYFRHGRLEVSRSPEQNKSLCSHVLCNPDGPNSDRSFNILMAFFFHLYAKPLIQTGDTRPEHSGYPFGEPIRAGLWMT